MTTFRASTALGDLAGKIAQTTGSPPPGRLPQVAANGDRRHLAWRTSCERQVVQSMMMHSRRFSQLLARPSSRSASAPPEQEKGRQPPPAGWGATAKSTCAESRHLPRSRAQRHAGSRSALRIVNSAAWAARGSSTSRPTTNLHLGTPASLSAWGTRLRASGGCRETRRARLAR